MCLISAYIKSPDSVNALSWCTYKIMWWHPCVQLVHTYNHRIVLARLAGAHINSRDGIHVLSQCIQSLDNINSLSWCTHKFMWSYTCVQLVHTYNHRIVSVCLVGRYTKSCDGIHVLSQCIHTYNHRIVSVCLVDVHTNSCDGIKVCVVHTYIEPHTGVNMCMCCESFYMTLFHIAST